MKRALTGIAAAAVVLGSVSPMAFAATTTSGLTKAGQLPIVVNGSVLSNPYEMTGKDSGNTTAFFPVYYFNQALAKIGYTATWDGTTHTWAITAPGVTAAPVAGGVGTGNTTITVNGTVVKMINTQAAKDPAASKSAAATTYLPAYYVDEILTAIGAQGTFSGQTGLKITGGVQGQAGLSALSVTGESVGTGSQTSPAAATTGTGITLSTTLTDASGNPVAGTLVTFDVNVNGGSAPTVTSNGASVEYNGGAGTSASPYTYQVATSAAGVASLTLNSSSAQSYTVQATAPFNNASGQAITTGSAYIEFGAQGGIIISPASDTVNFPTPTDATQGLVPVTATVIPASAGANVANIPVTFNLTNNDFAGATFANVSGQAIAGNTLTVNTNSSGVATVYLIDNTTTDSGTPATVSASYTNSNGVTATSTNASVSWGGIGTASKTNTLSFSNTTPNATGIVNATVGTNVTVSGQLQDANGNPVANAQVLVVSANDKGSYVSNSTTTAFPNAVPSTGATNPGAYGDVISTDANGNFSFVVTDANVEAPEFELYSIQANGTIGNLITATPVVTAQNYFEVNFQSGSTLTQIGAASNPSTLGETAYSSSSPVPTSISNVSYQVSGLNGDSKFEAGNVSGAPVSILPYSGTTPVSGNVNYTATVNKSADIVGFTVDDVKTGSDTALPASGATQYYELGSTAVNTIADANGVNYLPINGGNGLQTANVSVQESGGKYTITVNGQELMTSATGDASSYTAYQTDDQPTITFFTQDETAENPTLTVSSGSINATANLSFVAGQVGSLAASPSVATAAPGTSVTETFTAEDANGNAVAYAPITLSADANSAVNGLWITQVNGNSLSQGLGENNTSVPTPIPLYATTSGLGYSAVVVPGVVSWSGDSTGTSAATAVATTAKGVQLYTDASGKVSVTFSNQDVPFWGNNTPTDAATVAASQTPFTASAYINTIKNVTNVGGATAYTFTIGGESASAEATADAVAGHTITGSNDSTINY